MVGPIGPFGAASNPGANGPSGAYAPVSPTRHPIGSWPVPMRPGASLVLHFLPEFDTVMVTVSDKGVTSPLARFTGGDIEYPCGPAGWLVAGSEEGPWAIRNLTDAGILAVSALKMSGDFCGNQGFSDYKECSEDPLWEEIVSEVRRSHTASLVMLT